MLVLKLRLLPVVNMFILMYSIVYHPCVHVLMRDERRKEERKKQARSNKQQRGKATQHTQGSDFS